MYFLTLFSLLTNNSMVTLLDFNVSIRMRELINVTMIRVNTISQEQSYVVIKANGKSYDSENMSEQEALILHDQLLSLVNDIDQIKHFVV